MKSLTLAAGLGSRLRPLTNEIPKCMVPFQGISIIERQIKKLRDFEINKNYVVTGYLHDKVSLMGSTEIYNQKFDQTNMVYSWSLAQHLLDNKEPLIVSYGDIIYSDKTMQSLISMEKDIFGIVSDRNWENYWKLRSDEYLDDVESFSTNQQGNIKSIGQKWSDKSEILGQYIGLFIVPICYHEFIRLKLNEVYNDESVHNMYMTDFLQMLIKCGLILKPIYIDSGWLEFDCTNDLNPQFETFLNA